MTPNNSINVKPPRRRETDADKVKLFISKIFGQLRPGKVIHGFTFNFTEEGPTVNRQFVLLLGHFVPAINTANF